MDITPKLDTVFKLMSAYTLSDVTEIKFPILCSPKIDGVRCFILDGAKTKSLQQIPNSYIRECLKDLPNGLDGELVVGSPTANNCFKVTHSAVMSELGVPDFKFYIFDYSPSFGNSSFHERYGFINEIKNEYIVPVYQSVITNIESFMLFDEECVLEGYEGTMGRDPNGIYFGGKCAETKGGLFKHKRFSDSEAEILDFVPLVKNNNTYIVKPNGRRYKPTTKANTETLEKLGAFVVKDIYTGHIFNVGSGLSKQERIKFWEERDKHKGSIITYKYFPVGNYVLPRHPVYKGPRSKLDLIMV